MESKMVTVLSSTIQVYNNERFYLCGSYFQHKGKRLHRVVWEDTNGPIPEGYDVHHLNGDRSNNQIENLALLARKEHHSYHGKQISKAHPEHIHEIRKAASEWHGSEAGLKWHSARGKQNWETQCAQEYTCSQCGKTFLSRRCYGDRENRFCSNACKSRFRFLSGVDDVDRICECCGQTFRVNKYAKKRFCSRKCAVRKKVES